MRVMILVKATTDSEAGKAGSPEFFRAMGKFNEELVNAGVMLAGEGLHPTSKAKRVRCVGKERKVVDGPFAETKELLAGFWLWQVKSIDEAVEWVRRSPFENDEIEIRPVMEEADFGDTVPADVVELERELRERTTTATPR
jgi:hypothetical protein